MAAVTLPMYSPSSSRGQREFFMAFAVALVIHLLAFFGSSFVPQIPVRDIPVRMLNVKLGDEEVQYLEAIAPTVNKNSARVDDMLEKQFTPDIVDNGMPGLEEKAEKQSKYEKKNAVESRLKEEKNASSTDLESTARQFVRERAQQTLDAQLAKPLSSQSGSVLGNSEAANAEVLRRYEQMISGWMKKNQIYPEEARRVNMTGKGMLRIRIDRQGNIRYYIVEQRTGKPLLDRAMVDMVKQANPVPPVPADYKPQQDQLEFLVPVSFYL